jgi:hypothetical protein
MAGNIPSNGRAPKSLSPLKPRSLVRRRAWQRTPKPVPDPPLPVFESGKKAGEYEERQARLHLHLHDIRRRPVEFNGGIVDEPTNSWGAW